MTATATLVLVHSPLVGPSTWQPVAAVLTERGRRVVVPSLAEAMAAGPPFHARIVDAVAKAVAVEPSPGSAGAPDPGTSGGIVVVAHSGAGALLYAMARAIADRTGVMDDAIRVVFVDAVLPTPGRSWLDTAPDELVGYVRGMVDESGLLPPWHEWFGPDALAAILPDATERLHFEAEVPRLPLSYFDERAADAGAPPAGCGYVRLSDGYDDETAIAERLGWPVVRVEADHLAMLTRPELVADAILHFLRPPA